MTGDAKVLGHREVDVRAVVLDRGLAGQESIVRGAQQVAKFSEVDLVEVAGRVGGGDQCGADLPTGTGRWRRPGTGCVLQDTGSRGGSR